MRSAITLIIAVVLLTVAPAAPPLTITDAGYFLTAVDANGVPTLERIDTVVDLRTGGDLPPTADDPPQSEPEPPPDGISADTYRWASQVDRSDEAQKYALIFETVRDGVLDGQVPIVKITDALKLSADGLIGDQWQEFRQRVGDHLVDSLTRGDLGTPEKAAGELELIRYGIAYSARETENALTDADAVAVVAKVNSVIDSLGE